MAQFLMQVCHEMCHKICVGCHEMSIKNTRQPKPTGYVNARLSEPIFNRDSLALAVFYLNLYAFTHFRRDD